jgi:hypothetical protein
MQDIDMENQNLNHNKMKSKIANWMYSFWCNNHTHYWIAFDPNSLREKCKYCEKFKSE